MSTSLPTAGTDQRRPIALEGGHNFRDLGGYRTGDGRQVKWGLVYRSGSMAGLTPNDHTTLSRLAIKAVCDFRTEGERRREPNRWCEAANVSYWARDYGESFGELRSLMRSGEQTVEAAREAMIAGYRRIPFEQAPAYREVFRRLAAAETPLVFNCSAGKDRAGTAAALLLSALGVPRETVVEDYVLTNQALAGASRFLERTRKQGGSLASNSGELVAIVLRADEQYLRAALDAVENRYGSVTGYVREALELSDAELRSLRDHLLE
jgi:protein-tyrosine phosphatase